MERGKPRWICATHGRMAPELLLEWTGSAGLPVDVEAVAEALGVIIARDDLAPYRSVLAVSSPYAGIIVHDALDAVETRFAIAHALGHLVLHDGGEFRELDFDGRENEDVEANLYAAKLLMPEDSLRHALVEDPMEPVLAARFGVSEPLLASRIRQTLGPPVASD